MQRNNKIENAKKSILINLFYLTTAILVYTYCVKFFDYDLTSGFEFVVVVYMWIGFCIFMRFLQWRKAKKTRTHTHHMDNDYKQET